MEEFIDLLNPESVELHKKRGKNQWDKELWNTNKIEVKYDKKKESYFLCNVKEIEVNAPEECLAYLHEGGLERNTAKTKMNEESSRSHAIFTVRIDQTTFREFKDSNGEDKVFNDKKHSKFHFVDLAGSESIKKTESEGIT